MPAVGEISRYDELGAYAVFMRLPEAALTPDILPAALPRSSGCRHPLAPVETLAAYLDHAGNSPRTAAAPHIHRTSLYYRLGRVREITGADLDDGATRLALQVGLAILPLLTLDDNQFSTKWRNRYPAILSLLVVCARQQRLDTAVLAVTLGSAAHHSPLGR